MKRISLLVAFALITILSIHCNENNDTLKIKNEIVIEDFDNNGSGYFYKYYKNTSFISDLFFWQYYKDTVTNIDFLYVDKSISDKLNEKKAKYYQEITFDKNTGFEKFIQFYYNSAFGYSVNFKEGIFEGLEQFSKIGDFAFQNQYMIFDYEGNLRKDESFFYTLDASKNILSLNEPVNINIDLVAPFYKDGGMLIIEGDFDRNFKILDSTSLDTIFCLDFKGTINKSFNKNGTNVVRGLILNTKDKNCKNLDTSNCKTMTFLKLFEVK